MHGRSIIVTVIVIEAYNFKLFQPLNVERHQCGVVTLTLEKIKGSTKGTCKERQLRVKQHFLFSNLTRWIANSNITVKGWKGIEEIEDRHTVRNKWKNERNQRTRESLENIHAIFFSFIYFHLFRQLHVDTCISRLFFSFYS